MKSGAWRWVLALLVSSAVAYGAAWYAVSELPRGDCRGHTAVGYDGEWYANWDGQWYKHIMLYGYQSNEQDKFGPAVFFPLYPLLASIMHAITNLKPEWCLLAVTWAALIGFCIIWQRYIGLRFPEQRTRQHYAMLLVLFWPTAFFLRMTYTESLFLLLVALMFYGFGQRWAHSRLILICGLAAATRPTGIICALALGWHVFSSYPQRGWRRGYYALLATIAGAWGLGAYMLFLWLQHGDALLFFRQHEAWGMTSLTDRLWDIVTLKPLLPATGSFSEGTWIHWEIANKYLWAGAVLILILGAVKRWLTGEEIVYAFMMLIMIYVMSTHRNMASVGRYLLAVLPLYICIARLLPAKKIVSGILLAGSAALMGYYSGAFARWECMY